MTRIISGHLAGLFVATAVVAAGGGAGMWMESAKHWAKDTLRLDNPETQLLVGS